MNIILDACVLYSAPLRDFLLNLADLEVFKPKWTNQINQEWLRNLTNNRKDLKPKRLLRTIEIMNFAFPEANINDYENIIDEIELPDKDDRHVLAAAIKSKSEYIITLNLKDFPINIMNKYNVKAIDPDEFTVELIRNNKKIVIEAFENQHETLILPKYSKTELLETLKTCGLKESMKLIKSYT